MADNPDKEIEEEAEAASTTTVSTNSDQSRLHSDPSAVVLLVPRDLPSQVGFEADVVASEQVQGFTTVFDDAGAPTKSTFSLQVSRGKSRVNLTDPSRIHRRVPFRPELSGQTSRFFSDPDPNPDPDADSAAVTSGTKKTVKFITMNCTDFEEAGGSSGPQTLRPQDMIFPQPVSEPPMSEVKSEYDFYKPGQTLETVLGKVQKLKIRMEAMKKNLKQLRVSCDQPFEQPKVEVDPEACVVEEPEKEKTEENSNVEKVQAESQSENGPDPVDQGTENPNLTMDNDGVAGAGGAAAEEEETEEGEMRDLATETAAPPPPEPQEEREIQVDEEDIPETGTGDVETGTGIVDEDSQTTLLPTKSRIQQRFLLSDSSSSTLRSPAPD